jgi:hypothetical protein
MAKATEIHDRDYAKRRARFAIEVQHRDSSSSSTTTATPTTPTTPPQ